jgi:hypothetical protein
VTGIVDVENTLMIGEYFGIWPRQCYSVEADIPADTFGRMVIADAEGRADEDRLASELGFSPHRMIGEISKLAAGLARSGSEADLAVQPKFAHDLAPAFGFMRNTPVDAARTRGG